jgi:hypothetical protein
MYYKILYIACSIFISYEKIIKWLDITLHLSAHMNSFSNNITVQKTLNDKYSNLC